MNSKSLSLISVVLFSCVFLAVVRTEELNNFDMDLQNYDANAQQSSCSSCPNFHSDDESNEQHGGHSEDEGGEHK